NVESAQRGAEDACMPQQGRGRVDVCRCGDLFRDPRERHFLAIQLAAAAGEVVHGTPASAGTGSADGAPASAPSLAGGCGGPFAPQYAVASAIAASSARSIRTGWRG